MMDEMGEGAAQKFHAARDAYKQARLAQRKVIVEALRKAGFEVRNGGNAGRGVKNYTSGGRLNPPFDLSGWMWVAAHRGDVHVLVSLQVLDQDPRSLNIHALMDRVGVEVFRDGDSFDSDDPLFESAITGFELPLTQEEVDSLVSMVEARAAAYR